MEGQLYLENNIAKRTRFISPEVLIGFPRAQGRNDKERKGRKKRRNAILTVTPEKLTIEASELQRNRKYSVQKSSLKRRREKMSIYYGLKYSGRMYYIISFQAY